MAVCVGAASGAVVDVHRSAETSVGVGRVKQCRPVAADRPAAAWVDRGGSVRQLARCLNNECLVVAIEGAVEVAVSVDVGVAAGAVVDYC